MHDTYTHADTTAYIPFEFSRNDNPSNCFSYSYIICTRVYRIFKIINILIKFYLDMAVIAVDASERPSHFPYKISLNSVQSHPPIVPRMAKIIAVEVMKTMYTLKTRTAFSFSGLTLLPHACIQMFQIIHRSNYRFSSFFFCVLLLLLLVLAKDTLD